MAIKFLNTVQVDTDVLYVDASSDKVGIGTTSPSTVLEVSSSGVNGVDISQSASNASQSGRLFFTTNTASEGFALFNSNGTFQVNSGGIPNNTSGTNRISIIGSSGNVGIGTTSPGSKLTVDGSTRLGGDVEVSELLSGDKVLTLTANTGSFDIGDIDGLGDQAFISGDSSNISINVNGNTSLYCDSNNRVGIGTTQPFSKLDVYGGLRLGTTGDFNIAQSPFSTTTFYTTAGNGSTIVFGAPASYQQNVSVQGDLYVQGGSTSNYLGTKQGGVFNNRLNPLGDNYLNSGNLGIGATNPQAKLDVEQSNSSSNTVFLSNSYNNKGIRLGNAGYGTISGFQDSNDTTSGSAYGLLIGLNTFYNGTNFSNDNQYVDPSSILFRDGDIRFHTNDISATGTFTPAERVRITKAGNVGIGTTSPSSKLQVNGGVQLANDTASPSATKAGTFRYRTSGNNSYVDMCMQTGASTYAWVNIVTNSW